MKFDATFGAKSLKNDYGLNVLGYSLSPPEPKLTILEIPGTSDVIDLSEAVSGDVEYKIRTLEIVADFKGVNESYFARYSRLMNDLHGRNMRIVISWDSAYYWEGRVSVQKPSTIQGFGHQFKISADVSPYKYETQSSMEPWEWDSFSFEDGIIRNYYDISVPGAVTIIGRRKRVCPKIITTNVMTVTYLGNIYNLSLGENIIPDIFLGEGTHVLSFSGSGTVSIDYRGGSL